MKKYFHKIHIYLSVFFLPVALLYAITGALYIFDIKGESLAEKQTYSVHLGESLASGQMGEFLVNYLKNNNITLPSNLAPREAKGGGVEVGGIRYSASIKARGENLYEITTLKRSIYECLVLLHKSKGGFYFDILAIGFAITLVVLYFSGFIITSFCKKNRKESIIVFAIGAGVTTLFAALSV